MLFPSHSDPQVAQVILAGIAASIMTVVSIVFAILLMTLTLASMQFSPRIIVSFVAGPRDAMDAGNISRHVLLLHGGASGGAISAAALRACGHGMGAMLLALACVGWLLFFIHHISQAISVNQIVDRIAAETEAMIDEMMPWPHRDSRPERPTMPRGEYTWETPLSSDDSGYIRFLDIKRLVELAKSYHVKIHVVRRVGQFVPAGVAAVDAVQRRAGFRRRRARNFANAFDLGPVQNLAAGRGIRSLADCRYRLESHFAGGQ